MTNGKH